MEKFVDATTAEYFADCEQAAKQGNLNAQVELGKQLLRGRITQKDEGQAYYWFCQAAGQEDEIAKMWKGHCLLYGLGVQKDEDAGSTLLYNALNYNFPGVGESQRMQSESQFDWEEDMMQLFWDLADAYENGLGVPKRQHLAGYYYNMVADDGDGWPEAVEKMRHYKQKGLFHRWKRID